MRSVGFLLASTSLRIVLVPVLMALLLVGEGRYGLAAGLFVLAALTDFFDGYLARRWEITTTLGSFLDTTADKLLVAGVLIALVAVERASPWVAAVVVARELIILGLRGALAAGGDVMQPSLWGKLKTSLQFGAILLALLRPGELLAGAYLDEWVMVAAAVVTVGSGVDYLARAGSALWGPAAAGASGPAVRSASPPMRSRAPAP